MEPILEHQPKEIRTSHAASDYLKGVSSPIPYVIRITDGNWHNYFSPLTPQRYGMWDTDCCWEFSTAAIIEAQLNYLKQTGQLSASAIAWYQANGYIDANGLFRVSRRFIAILSDVEDNGNDPWNACLLTSKYGILPSSDLEYTNAQSATHNNQASFDADYFNPTAITFAMRQKALQAMQFINFQYEYLNKYNTPEVPRQDLVAAQYQSPLLISIPIPQPETLWNVPVVASQPQNLTLRHVVAVAGINQDGTWPIHDNYVPEWKTLSADYYIGEAIVIVITAQSPAAVISIPQPWWRIIWTNVFAWLNSQ